MTEPKHASGFRIGIVNPLTLVGNELKTILRQRSFPFERLVLLDSTGQSAGALTDAGDEPAVVSAVTDDELEELDLVFFCGPAAANREWIERHSDDRFISVDVSQPSAVEGKLAVAGINIDAIAAGDDVIISPHPIAIPIALILHQIETIGGVASCAATVIQPASEFEQDGVEELARQTMNVLNAQTMPNTIFDRQLAFNLYPAVERREEFILSQIRSLTDIRAEIALFVTQGTVFHGHTFSIFMRLHEKRDRGTILEALAKNPAIAIAEGDQSFSTIDAAGQDQVLVADVRQETAVRNGFWVWAVCDNLRRSSALNAVLIAEEALFGTASIH